MTEDVLISAARLSERAEPYVLVTVVDVERPASARRGDRALVSPDGALSGWVGGACAEPVVVREALRALADGESRLVRIGPPGQGEPRPGVLQAESTCASEGTVEVLVEPQLPPPRLAVAGDSPAAKTLVELAEAIGWQTTDEIDGRVDAVVVATMGQNDEAALTKAIATGAGYVGLVASSRRARTVLEGLRELGLDPGALARVRSPAGLDLGPSSQEEIAVAVLAELVAWRHTLPIADTAPVEAIDPVCGMTVALDAHPPTLEYAGVTYAFCAQGCRARFEADPTRYVEVAAR